MTTATGGQDATSPAQPPGPSTSANVSSRAAAATPPWRSRLATHTPASAYASAAGTGHSGRASAAATTANVTAAQCVASTRSPALEP